MSEVLLGTEASVIAEFDSCCDAFGLGPAARDRLARVISGYIPGNRDKPVYELCLAVDRAGRRMNRTMDATAQNRRSETPESGVTRLVQNRNAMDTEKRALLYFLITMDDFSFMGECSRWLWRVHQTAAETGAARPADHDAALTRKALLSETAAAIARQLHAFRMKHLEWAGSREKFIAMARWARRKGRERASDIRDGDALAFWVENSGWAQNTGRTAEGEGEGGRGRWMRLDRTAEAFADFVRANRDVADRARFTRPDTIEDHQQQMADDRVVAYTDEDDPLSCFNLQDAISGLGASRLRILMDSEVDRLGAMCRLGEFASAWPRTAMALFRMAPVQNIPIERLRRSMTLCGTDIDRMIEDVPTVADTAAAPARLHRITLGAAGMLERLPATEFDLPPPEPAMLRRKSFTALDPGEIQDELQKICRPLLNVALAMSRLVSSWTLSAERDASLHDRDLEDFRMTLKRLYVPAMASSPSATGSAGRPDAGSGTAGATGRQPYREVTS